MTELVLLRPYWLLALLPLVWLLWRRWHQQRQHSGWKSWLPPAFQPYLLQAGEQTKTSWGLVALACFWLILVAALSGPSWHSEEIPAQKNQAATVIVLDLSLSMYADDLQPNRITRVQFKLTDLLKQHPELRVGMVAYSGSAHIITPISDDNSTLLNILPHLNPLIMPSYGANAVEAFALANKLLQNSGVNRGHIIWLTDDIELNQTDNIKRYIEQSNVSLSILAIGTEQGAAVNIPQYGLLKDRNDKLVQATVPLNELAGLARDVYGQFGRLQFDDSDLAKMLPPYAAAQSRDENEQNVIQALDYGVYLLWLLIPLAALAARKGWLFSLAGLILIPGLVVSPNQAFAESAEKPALQIADRWQQLFLTGDQRGYQAWLQNDLIAAEREFDNPAWQGMSLYRQGKYAEAEQAFARDLSAQGHYNRGNALAQQGNLAAAKLAYEQALALQADLKQAQHNLALIEQALKQQQQQQENQSQLNDEKNPPSAPSALSGDDSGSGDDQQQTDQQQDSQQSTDKTESAESSGDAEGQTKQPDQANESEHATANATNENGAENQKPPTEDEAKNTAFSAEDQVDENTTQQNLEQNAIREQQQADQAWLNQVRDEPGLFLKRKFDYQYQQNAPANPQQNTRKLW